MRTTSFSNKLQTNNSNVKSYMLAYMQTLLRVNQLFVWITTFERDYSFCFWFSSLRFQIHGRTLSFWANQLSRLLPSAVKTDAELFSRISSSATELSFPVANLFLKSPFTSPTAKIVNVVLPKVQPSKSLSVLNSRQCFCPILHVTCVMATHPGHETVVAAVALTFIATSNRKPQEIAPTHLKLLRSK